MHSTNRLIDDFTFNVGMSQVLLAHTSQNEWVVNSSWTHHMDKDAYMFSFLDIARENMIYIVYESAIDTTSDGDVTCRCGKIVNVFHAPSLSANLLLVSKLT